MTRNLVRPFFIEHDHHLKHSILEMKVEVQHRLMKFKTPSGTSRGVLRTKDSWFLKLTDKHGQMGIGECSVISGLSPDLENGLLPLLNKLSVSTELDELTSDSILLDKLPALRFAIESATIDLKSPNHNTLFHSDFLDGRGIPINGLVWMGSKQFMHDQIKTKIEEGYNCIKIKIAAIDFNDELELLSYIRSEFSEKDIEIRVDANGGFKPSEAMEKLSRLSDYRLHSIEQPIAPRQYEHMAQLCQNSPLAIALDEELIGVSEVNKKQYLLDKIEPQYIILKPSLIGGYKKSQEWIEAAEKRNIGWWITSALEANIGLNAIAQWTATLNSSMHQGLGTGQLFSNNIASPLYISGGKLFHGTTQWDNKFA